MTMDSIMTKHTMMIKGVEMTIPLEAKNAFNEDTQLWKCPREGCKCSYKGLATLNSHFNDKHPNGAKPVWIAETHDRLTSAKYNSIKVKKATSNAVPNANYQDFKSAQFKAIKAETPTMKFGDIMKAISVRWAEVKSKANVAKSAVKSAETVSADAVPTPNTPDGVSQPSFTLEEEECIINEFLNKFVNTATQCDYEADALPTEANKCDDANDSDDDANESDDDGEADIEYDTSLVECCKAWRCGGFVKAYRLLNDGKYSFKSSQGKNEEGKPSRTYTVSIDGEKRTATTLADIREVLEDTYMAMCDAYYDYSRSADYVEDDECDFDDEVDWIDVGYELVNADTIDAFLD
jgi:hypothetical protein